VFAAQPNSLMAAIFKAIAVAVFLFPKKHLSVTLKYPERVSRPHPIPFFVEDKAEPGF